jgi:hypothetical protein
VAWDGPIISIADASSNSLRLGIRLVSDIEHPRRFVTLQRDGADFVVSFHPENIVVFRHTEPNALRRMCTFLRWQIIADNSSSGATTSAAF